MARRRACLSGGVQHRPGSRPRKVTRMDELGFPVEVVSGVPVVTTPGEIDIANAPGFRPALVEAAARGHGSFRGGHEPDPVL
jgi:hypothetical protein